MPGSGAAAAGGPRINPRLALALGVVGVSFSSILVRLAAAPALVTATWRLLWTVLLLTPWVLLRSRGQLKLLRLKDILMCGASGVFLALHFLSWFESLRHTSVAVSTALVCTDAIFTALGFALFLKGRIPRLGVGAICITFCGSVVIAASSGGVSGSFVGIALALAGAVFASAYMLIGRVARARISTAVYTWLVYTACALTLLLFCAVSRTPVFGWPWREMGIGLANAVICTFLGHSVFSWCLRYLDPAYVTSAKLGEPVMAAVWAVLILREVPGVWQVAGGLIVIGGILLYTWADQRAFKAAREKTGG